MRTCFPSATRWSPLSVRLVAGLLVGLVSWLPTVSALAQNQPTGVILGLLPEKVAGVDAGELLLAELNCVGCHAAANPVKQRLASKRPPTLGEGGLRITPQYLRDFLTNPHGDKPGTTMPDLLHGMAAGEKAEAVEALTHFLTSITWVGATTPAPTADLFVVQRGKQLFHSVGCVACHAPQEAPPAAAGASPDLEALKLVSVPLGNLARKTTVSELAKFLMNPLKVRPSGRMPSLNLNESEATAIAMYLQRAQMAATDAGGAPVRTAGVKFEYFEAADGGKIKFDKDKPVASGSVAGFTLTPAKRKDNFGLKFSGVLTLAKAGDYTFYTTSDDGSFLYIGDKQVVDNGGVHPPQEKKGTIKLPAGDHPILVTFFNGGAGFELKVSYQGPGVAKQEIPGNVLSHLGRPLVPVDETKFAVDDAKVARGKELFVSLNCLSCHQVKGVPTDGLLAARDFAALNPAAAKSCVADQVPPGLPQFYLTASQRAAIRATLAKRAALSQPFGHQERVGRTLATFNCFACHARDGQGGPNTARADYFGVNGEVDLGDEGRMPPTLHAVGAKLQASWMKTVLTEAGAVRPYMATRMPQFGAANVGHLPVVFESADARADALPQPNGFAPGAAEAGKHGRRLVGSTGLSCIACHNFAGNKSLGVPALDLATTGQRLKWDWFRRYLLDPVSLRPGTRMPPFWPEGKAVNKDILAGNTEKQIDALWMYLARKNFTDLPTGLVQGKMEVVVTNEAVIYRNFIDGAGSRAIGVGYPEKANLAFDANDVRLALLWQGAFIDAARHRTGRGVGFEKPLGGNVLKLPAGPEFAVLADDKAAWPTEAGKKAEFQMRGYRLDDQQRPTFRYSFKTVDIEDFPVAVAGVGADDPFLQRTLTLKSATPVANLWFRAAVGAKIVAQPDGSFLVDERLKLRVTGEGRALVRESGGKQEVLVPVKFGGGAAKLVEEFKW